MTEINNIPKHWQVKKLGEVFRKRIYPNSSSPRTTTYRLQNRRTSQRFGKWQTTTFIGTATVKGLPAKLVEMGF
jgi:hypothetical protein